MRIRLLLSYKGTHFSGWQRQKKDRTVQGELEKAISELFQTSISLVGSGRTDAGVHALGQVAHFDVSKSLKKLNLVKALNHLSPDDISTKGAWEAPEVFHARFSAKKKTYHFFICNSKTPPAIARDFVWWLAKPLDVMKLNKMSQLLIGRHNFSSFETSGSDVKEKEKTIFSAKWSQIHPQLYRFSITGSGFLKQGVRNMVGTQVDLFSKKNYKARFQEIFKSQSRSKALGTAPGSGLYLIQVYYPQILDRKCRRL